MSLDLSPEVEKAVRERAAAEGVSVDDLLGRTFAARGRASNPVRRVRALLADWRAADRTEVLPGSTGAETGEALFARWRELDAAMTADELEAEDNLWEDVRRGLDETRAALGMRPLSP
jgi:hypothetical protein